MMSLIISLLSGALGGNAAGKLMPSSSLGTIGNSIAGILGGGVGGTILGMIPGLGAVAEGAASGGMDPMSILSSVLGGGVGGGVLMAIIGFIKKAMG